MSTTRGRLSVDPAMRAVTGRPVAKNAASPNTVGRFETGMLAEAAVSRETFSQILDRIDRLRCYPT
jgi:hypothetical protein